MKLQAFFRMLPGQWHLLRHSDKGTIWNGKAQIEILQTDKLLYEEAVDSVQAGQHLAGFQRHLLRWSDKGILFYEAARPATDPFLVLGEETEASLCGSGVCGADSYQAKYDITDNDSWQVEYRVRGPRKNYHLHTVYKRLL